ncbi:DUF2199 domain-containing protein [Streptacidiphilus sp. P02-A3a]|nr:DUF2199 domain-containing protein [Streptacidiphilus sp. P02-A3a]
MACGLRRRRGQPTDSDLCVIKGQAFFIHGLTEIPVRDTGEVFSWGVWASLGTQTFQRALDRWEDPDRKQNPSSFGWLSTELPIYGTTTVNLKTSSPPSSARTAAGPGCTTTPTTPAPPAWTSPTATASTRPDEPGASTSDLRQGQIAESADPSVPDGPAPGLVSATLLPGQRRDRVLAAHTAHPRPPDPSPSTDATRPGVHHARSRHHHRRAQWNRRRPWGRRPRPLLAQPRRFRLHQRLARPAAPSADQHGPGQASRHRHPCSRHAPHRPLQRRPRPRTRHHPDGHPGEPARACPKDRVSP